MTTTVDPSLTQPAAPATPTAVAPATPPAPPAPPAAVQPAPGDPAWLNPRLAQAKTNAEIDLAKSLGFSSVDEMKAAATNGKKAADAAKTDATRVAELTTSLATANTTIATQRAVFVVQAAKEMATLTPEQQNVIKGIAGEDAEQQILTIEKLRPTWTAPAAPAAPATAKTPVAAPATTTAAPPGPATTVTVPPPVASYAAIYDDLLSKNPMKASAFYQAYGSQITAERAATRK